MTSIPMEQLGTNWDESNLTPRVCPPGLSCGLVPIMNHESPVLKVPRNYPGFHP